MAAVAGPRPPAARIASIDALRGLALCGILLINIFQMGGPVAMERPLAPPAPGDADWQVWIAAQLFVAGTMRGLFSLLFGAGLLIFLGDDEGADRSSLCVRRLLLLLSFGILDSTLLLWPGDILLVYALTGFVVLIFRPLKPAWLLLAAGLVLLLVSIWTGIEASAIPPAATVYTPQMLGREEAARLGGYGGALAYMSYVGWIWTTDPVTLRWIGDAAGMMLVGMAFYRMGLLGGAAHPRVMLRMAMIGYGVGLVLRIAHVVLVLGNDGGPTLVSGLIDQPGRLAIMLGHFGLFQLAWHRFRDARLMRQWSLMGRMALTLYLGQSLLAALVFSGFGLGLWNRLSWPALWLVALAMLGVEALFATLWFKRFRFGPMEWLWRWGTYGRRPGTG
jgi:uncharacterized protein